MIETWRFLAGLGLFLYGMNLLEHVLKKLSGRSLKLFLKDFTRNTFKAIIGGTLLTGLLQSSSVVSLLVLAFVESGVLSFRNALGVILGSNLGTTLSSWIVATVGFKLDIESFALPVVAISAIIMFFVQKRRELYNLLRLFLSLGLLFMGLAFMKTGAEHLVTTFDISAYTHYGSWAFVLIGFALTTVIQSSSAAVAITLTAVHSQIIDFPAAAAVVIGSELGTTIKIVLGGLQGNAEKKRVAWANFIFNLVTCLGAFLALSWLTRLIVNVVGVSDPLIALVFFQSLINLLAIILFFPFIGWFTRMLGRRFGGRHEEELRFIDSATPVIPELAVESLFREADRLLSRTREFMGMVIHSQADDEGWLEGLRSLTRKSHLQDAAYEGLKKTEGSVLEFYTQLQTSDLEPAQYDKVRQYIYSVRMDIHGAKSMKDIHHDFKELANTANDTAHQHYHDVQKDWKIFDASFREACSVTDNSTLFEELTRLMKDAFRHQSAVTTRILAQLKARQITEVDTSTLMNIQREVLSAKKSLLRSLAYLKLTVDMAREFEFLPEN